MDKQTKQEIKELLDRVDKGLSELEVQNHDYAGSMDTEFELINNKFDWMIKQLEGVVNDCQKIRKEIADYFVENNIDEKKLAKKVKNFL